MVSRASYAKGALRRESILEATMVEVASKPFERRSLRSIAKAIEVEPAHIVYYFGSRDGLLEAVIDRWDDDTGEAAVVDTDPARPLDFFVLHVRLNDLVPGLVQLYLSLLADATVADHPSHDYIAGRLQRTQGSVAEAIRVEQAAGLIADDVDATAVARSLIALADGLQAQAFIDPAVDAVETLRAEIGRLRSLADDPLPIIDEGRESVLEGIRMRIASATSGV